MSDHSSSVFNNNCLKLPRNPRSDHPLPVYEQKYLNQLQNEATKLNLETSDEIDMKSTSSKDPVKSYLEFFDSIPEYDELNHLSNKEFYKRIESLKEKQKSYSDYVQNEAKYSDKNPEWLEEYKDYAKKKFVDEKKKKTKPFCVTPILSKSPKDVESISGDLSLKPPSRRSVRIETPSEKLSDTPSDLFRRPKSRLPSPSSKGQDDWDNFSIDEYKLDLEEPSPVQSKSVPNSPTRSKHSVGWKDNGITIPKPFEMTVRDEENKIIDEVLAETKPPKSEKSEMFKAHPVPIESQIPLFDKIVADQEKKNRIVRERTKAYLQAQMRPFSFTKRDEEIQKLKKGLSKSSPSLFLDDPPIKIKKFKAKPIPKNLFSNYIYKKMHEDEFYRALQKKIRAEEMLRAASLPPSMAMRERTVQKYDVCPRSYRDLAENQSKKSKNLYKFDRDSYEKELEELKNEFLGISPELGNKSKSKRNEKKQKKKTFRNLSASSTNSRTPSSIEFQSINRSNLAALLRVQSARKKLEMEMCKKLEEAKLKEETRWREKLMRKKPVWQSLAYSHEEDLAMRLQLRRDEEKLRAEEHKLRMQLMLGRVHQQPTLFERQSQVKYPKSKEELLDKLYTEYKSRRDKRSMSDLSAEVKDAAIQALLEDDLKQDCDSLNSKESIQEEKEKDESVSSEENQC